MKNKKVVLIILVLVLIIAGIGIGYAVIKKQNNIKQDSVNQYTDNVKNVENKKNNNKVEDELALSGEQYNTTEVKDKDNNPVSIGQEDDKPMIILFWNLNNIDAFNTFYGFYEKYGEKVSFSAVVVDEENKDDVNNFLSENNITMQVVFDSENHDAANANDVKKAPTVVVINKDGEIINRVQEENINADVIEANLDIIIENF